MRRVGLITALVVVGSLALASVAWGDTITPMCTTAQGTQPCANGWYTTPVLQLTWTWSAGGTPSNCNEAAYASDSTSTVSCTVSWGQTGSTAYYTVRVETSNPTATAVPSRPPDSGGWYNQPLTLTFQGSSFSGIASCTSTPYTGPDTGSATVTGSCVDNAGKTVTATSAPFAYDAAPPSLAVSANAGDQSVALVWSSSGDPAPIVAARVTRQPDTTGGPAYAGDATGFEDTSVRDGVQYAYTVSVEDAAGNVASQTITATPGPRLLAPIANAALTAPPMLSWTPVKGASYYNVQLYRDGKVLSTWPAHARLQLRRSWKFDGRRFRLKPGRYRWYVWPGFGRRSAARYGHRIGAGTFVVARD
jgi:hypothetical protein